MDTPFQWTKQVASHFGGTRNPMVVHWPKGIKAKGELRTQFHHVHRRRADDPRRVPRPRAEGRQRHRAEADRGGQHASTRSTTRKAKGRRTTQYFEMFGNRGDLPRRLDGLQPARHALGHRRARRRLRRRPRGSSTTSTTTSARPTTSPTRTPRSSRNSRRSSSRRRRSTTCCRSTRVSPAVRPEAASPVSRRRAGPTTATRCGCRSRSGPLLFPNSHTITAELTVPKGRAEGVIACAGGLSAGGRCT